MPQQDIRSLSKEELTEILTKNGHKPFRAKQLYKWIWQSDKVTFDAMHNLPAALRNFLNRSFTFHHAHIAAMQKAKDGTVKTAFELHDNLIVEGVLIPSPSRATACISSQVGCSLNCTFCATGAMKMQRNLTATEIYDQVTLLNQLAKTEYKRHLSNIVIMGMGEPLLNYNNVMQGINRITADDGLGMSPRRITLSTAGIPAKIRQLADDNATFNLAISLHTANNDKRNRIMPINRTHSLTTLAEAIQYFHKKTGARITFEYLLMRNFNDSLDDARELAAFCRMVPCKVNLIEYNAVDNSAFAQATTENTQAFFDFLESKNMIVNLRRSKGHEIDAACGQLANNTHTQQKNG